MFVFIATTTSLHWNSEWHSIPWPFVRLDNKRMAAYKVWIKIYVRANNGNFAWIKRSSEVRIVWLLNKQTPEYSKVPMALFLLKEITIKYHHILSRCSWCKKSAMYYVYLIHFFLGLLCDTSNKQNTMVTLVEQCHPRYANHFIFLFLLIQSRLFHRQLIKWNTVSWPIDECESICNYYITFYIDKWY